MYKRKIVNKKLYKKVNNICRICKNDHYEVLDVHRIVSGESGGKYTRENSVSICSNCHRLVHNGVIKIIGWVKSTDGNLLHIIQNGEEKIL